MKLKLAAIALSAASLAGCDALSMSQKKQAASQPTSQPLTATAAAPKDAKADPRIEPNLVLAARVKQALQSEAKVVAAGIDVTAADGVVTLWGTTTTDDEKSRAGKVASSVDGVKSVENRIAVIKGS